MSRAESKALAGIHADKLSVLSAQLARMVNDMELDCACDLLPTVNHELQIVAGHVAALISESPMHATDMSKNKQRELKDRHGNKLSREVDSAWKRFCAKRGLKERSNFAWKKVKG